MICQLKSGERSLPQGFFREAACFFPDDREDPVVKVEVAQAYWDSRIAQPWQKVEWPECKVVKTKYSAEEVQRHSKKLMDWLNANRDMIHARFSNFESKRQIAQVAVESNVIPEWMLADRPTAINVVTKWKHSNPTPRPRQPDPTPPKPSQSQVRFVQRDDQAPDWWLALSSTKPETCEEFITKNWFTIFVHFNQTFISGSVFYARYDQSKWIESGKVLIPLLSPYTGAVALLVFPFEALAGSWARLEGPPELWIDGGRARFSE